MDCSCLESGERYIKDDVVNDRSKSTVHWQHCNKESMHHRNVASPILNL